jgi:predicted membrane channel-forming protein YqfA (hemolysin III family)
VSIRRLDWWIGLLFAIGSAGFALGAFPYVAARADPTAVGITFFVGSIFFTCAAALQLAQAVMGGGWLDRLATAVQFVGTLFFNWTTLAGLNDALDTQEQIRRVWAPDAAGSICFLVASYIAIVALCGRPWCRRRGDAPWRIAMLNMIGSVFFGISAITSFILPDTGEVLNADATNATTFLGAVCFLAGGLLLMPRLGRARAIPAAG